MTPLVRSVVAAAIVAGLATLAIVAVTRSHRDRPGLASTSDPAPGRRTELLTGLSRRLVPASDGGWTIGSLQENGDGGAWVLASAVARNNDQITDEAVDRALASSRAAVDGATPESRRRSALAVAQALALVDANSPSRAALAARVSTSARAHMDRGDAAWLSTLINASTIAGPAGEGAATVVQRLAGEPSCERLPGSGDRLPDPGGALVVLLRSLSTQRHRCDSAAGLLDRALAASAWNLPIAVPELSDLATLAQPLSAPQRRRMSARLDTWTSPASGASVDVSLLAFIERARVRAGIPRSLPDRVAIRIGAQVASHGRLPDRSTAPTTSIDVAVLRQLAIAGLVPLQALSDTRAAAGVTAGSTTADRAAATVDRLLLEGRIPDCHAPAPPTRRGRASMVVVLDRQIRWVVRQHCHRHLDVADAVRRSMESVNQGAAVPRAWITVVAACRLDPKALALPPGLRTPRRGVLADEPIWVLADAALAAPKATCRAERAG